MAVRAYRNRGSRLWDFFAHFVHGRALFLDIYKRYERRVLRSARGTGVDRADLVLPPTELSRLFHLERLRHLRDVRIGPMRDLAGRIFGDGGDDGLLDAYCGHMYHEVSILAEEHQSVGRFVNYHDPRRYRDLFAEVRGYYPKRLRRVRRFFLNANKRVEELLPIWSEERVVVRSAYLFGERIAKRAYGRGRHALYQRMYPEGGAIRGYLLASQSFEAAGFLPHAGRALGEGIQHAELVMRKRDLSDSEKEVLAEARALNRRLAGYVDPRAVAARREGPVAPE